MSEPEDLRRAMDKGARAASELEQTDAAFAEIERQIIEKWLSTALGETDFREKLFMQARSVRLVKAALNEAITNGTVAAHELNMAALLAPPKTK